MSPPLTPLPVHLKILQTTTTTNNYTTHPLFQCTVYNGYSDNGYSDNGYSDILDIVIMDIVI